MSSAYWKQPISEQATAVHEKVVSAEVLAQQVREEIVRTDADLRAWVGLSPAVVDDARRQDSMPGRRPLRGVSLGVKDLIDVSGLPTRAGSTITSSSPVSSDAPCVSRFRDLGAVVQGKTVTTEFGYFSPGPTRNPHQHEHTPGGSSSGSAAAVGAGVIPMALGTQTAGSLTRPAAYCGAAGLVLAHGSTDLSGVTGLSESLDSLGILTRDIADLQYVYSAFSGRSPMVPGRSTVRTVVVWGGSDLHPIHPAMSELINRLPGLLGGAGVETRALEYDDHVRTLADDHVTVMSHEAAGTLDGVVREHGTALSPQLRELVDAGRAVGVDEHAAALIRRDRSRDLLAEALGDHTVIVGPAAPGPAPHGLAATGSPVLSRPWQLLGCPVVVVPGATTDAGMPLGLQVIGLPGREAALFEVAAVLETELRSHPVVPA
ncbi:amidase [Gordonia McavH-238-E]|uniref:amidase n=1 Tax=Gordonia sp. McavH-238-E TaxID=2917736 RepID=UPI001EF63A0E|nr:amidase [Gordonia sp. McavH-238-E]MCG7631954.1 amidase [Gordonia sp. McavH-238-E]